MLATRELFDCSHYSGGLDFTDVRQAERKRETIHGLPSSKQILNKVTDWESPISVIRPPFESLKLRRTALKSHFY